jgi:hypothetical protein
MELRNITEMILDTTVINGCIEELGKKNCAEGK